MGAQVGEIPEGGPPLDSMRRLLIEVGTPIFDRETLLRQLLNQKLSGWLAGRRFYTIDLRDMRAIVRDISGLPEDASYFASLPTDLQKLQGVPFDALSAVNLRTCLELAMEYLGIDAETGPDLLGMNDWEKTMQALLALGEASRAPYTAAETDRYSPASVDAWTMLTLRTQVCALFEGRFFSVSALNQVASGLNALRTSLGVSAFDGEALEQYAALSALHGTDFAAMTPQVRAGLPDAVFRVLALSQESTEQLLGGSAWEEIKRSSEPRRSIEQSQPAKPGEPLSEAGGRQIQWRKFARALLWALILALGLSLASGVFLANFQSWRVRFGGDAHGQ